MAHRVDTPRHIAIIMDGNGRWAQERGLPRLAGHRAGALAIGPVLRAAADSGVEALTLYSFSSENWGRPTEEIDGLMTLCCEKLAEECAMLIESGVRLRRIGSREGMPSGVLAAFDEVERATAAGTRITMALAMNYGARGEITAAARSLAAEVSKGSRSVDSIDEASIARHLATAGLPELDLLIRTGGQRRLSNFLLWQASYAEILFVDRFWPEFTPTDLQGAIADFSARRRTFGCVADATMDLGNAPLGLTESLGTKEL